MTAHNQNRKTKNTKSKIQQLPEDIRSQLAAIEAARHDDVADHDGDIDDLVDHGQRLLAGLPPVELILTSGGVSAGGLAGGVASVMSELWAVFGRRAR